MLIQQYILQLQIAMHAVLLMHVGHSTNQLCENLLRLGFRKSSILDEVVVKLIAAAVFEDEPYKTLGDNNLVQSYNMWMNQLSMVVYFSCKIWVVFVCRFEDNLTENGKLAYRRMLG